MSSHNHNRTPNHVVILGGGITGLSAAFHLARKHPTVQITLVEKSARFGGWVRSERIKVHDSDGNRGSVLLEAGPRTIRPNAKSVLELVRPPNALVIPKTRGIYVNPRYTSWIYARRSSARRARRPRPAIGSCTSRPRRDYSRCRLASSRSSLFPLAASCYDPSSQSPLSPPTGHHHHHHLRPHTQQQRRRRR